ncbi:FYVE/PHD zinc finger [Glarea lozoyensis ATCC 20868]|uniref:FYVE/PHD zinc finger n=1 Tax=Glarea lozoyensis (strain ATCC 20868 / MF5171) TaxID=1116229 RepID=S3D476_GLAL2|nr:FYVE/PHD zinc finger [Glarea lozoyensis ATCC 20868]EPE26856.1 FYVE/PHD zinc finger [Glarea lozoyensis ATCC 20868]
MSSDATPQTPTATGSKDTAMSDSSPKYVPQFSAATEMILKRIQSGASSTIGATPTLSSIGITGTPPGYEDMRRNVLMGMKTTLNMEIPASKPIHYKSRTSRLASAGNGAAGSASAAGSPIAPRPSTTPKSRGSMDAGSGKKTKPGPKGKGPRGTKRKRGRSDSLSEEESEESEAMSKLGGDSDSDDAESVTQFPKVTQSGRQIVKPAQFVPAPRETNPKRRAPSKKTPESALCKRCGRGQSPQSNQIVFCDGCNLAWHQMCHDPPILPETVKDESAPWFCSDCNRKKGNKGAGSELRLTSWQGRSEEEVGNASLGTLQIANPYQKRSYFNSLPHAQLVNLLIQATVLHPNIPIFPQIFDVLHSQAQRAQSSDRRANSHSQQSVPPSATASLFSRAEAHPNGQINFIRKIQPGQASPASALSPSQSLNHASSAPPVINAPGGDSRESTPASPPYPKPGNGLMAKLGPDEEDMDWLVDSNDFEAFSHTIYDEHGERVGDNGVTV